MIELSRIEIALIKGRYVTGKGLIRPDIRAYVQAVAQEAHQNALRQVVVWGEVVCYEHKPSMKKRRRCDKCWQELKKQAEGK